MREGTTQQSCAGSRRPAPQTHFNKVRAAMFKVSLIGIVNDIQILHAAATHSRWSVALYGIFNAMSLEPVKGLAFMKFEHLVTAPTLR